MVIAALRTARGALRPCRPGEGQDKLPGRLGPVAAGRGGCLPGCYEAGAFLVAGAGRGRDEDVLGGRERRAAPVQPGPLDAAVVLDRGTLASGQLAEDGENLGAVTLGDRAERARGVRCLSRVAGAGPDRPADLVDAPGHPVKFGADGGQSLACVHDIDGADLAAVAAITLPLAQGDVLPVQYDELRRAWTVSSDNPNLRIAARVGPLPVTPAGFALGFALTAGPSFMQVGRYRGPHYLRDGYHRAFGLLSRGIAVVPAFVGDIHVFEELVPDPRTMLPQDGYLGDRPPGPG